MTEAELLALVNQGESLHCEFKRDSPIPDVELAEAVACLANTEGGWLLLGVEDDGSISGLHPKRLPVNPHLLQALIANKTSPGVQVEVHQVQTRDGVVVALRVARAPHLVALTDGRVPRRFIVGRGQPECRFLQPHELASRLAELYQHDYTAQALQKATWEDLNPLEFERLRQTIQRNPRADKTLLDLPDEELAQALGLVVSGDGRLLPTVAGVLLLGRDEAIRRLVPTHEAAFQVLREDRQVAVNEFFHEPLLKLFERLEQRLQAHNPEEEFSFGLYRIPVPLFPPEAFREALANALVHRDYALLQAVYVRLDPDAGGLVISNPGGFVEGVTLDNLLVVEPRPRNRTLADAFKRLGLVERTGRGIDRIFREVLGLGRRPPDYSGTTRDTVKVVLPGGKADLNFVRLILEVQDRQRRELGWPHLLVLRQVTNEGELTVAETARLIQQGESRARTLLEEMVEMGLLEARGAKRGRVYHLSAGVYKRLGRPSAYVHRRGFDALQQEQMVLTYLKSHGSITRGEVAGLCHLTPSQAEYLMRKLKKAGKVRLVGKGRSAHYEYLSINSES
ncbi:MAG: ATPase AAA [Meiothermus sp.]|uniref:ATP-binding protein n=1 Tax=Meiothermus sp. TaxID=1955249 RepID=UPI0021DC613D|nr:ATP-binding protein [Meiothermus sp.]GIW28841.1 MAG: ATPase AAA [Meiothermus sp.]